MSSKFFRDCTTGKTPKQEIAIIFVSVPDACDLYCALPVKGTHVFQPSSKAVRRHGNFHDKRKVAGDSLAAWSAFVVSSHGLNAAFKK